MDIPCQFSCSWTASVARAKFQNLHISMHVCILHNCLTKAICVKNMLCFVFALHRLFVKRNLFDCIFFHHYFALLASTGLFECKYSGECFENGCIYSCISGHRQRHICTYILAILSIYQIINCICVLCNGVG